MNTWLRNKVDKHSFGVCTRIAACLNMRIKSVRLFFIYSSFLTLGSPVLVYMALAFLLRLKDLINSKRSSVFDL